MRTPDLQTLVRLFGVEEGCLLAWIGEFGDHLSRSANVANAQERRFTERDLAVLIYVHEQAEDGNSSDEIHEGLNSGHHETDEILELAQLHTPIFQDLPDEIDEIYEMRWHSVLIGGMASRDWFQIAQSYKRAADSLVVEALRNDEPHELAYPIFYLYRHCLELYLKTMLGGPKGHDLGRLIKALEEKHDKKLGGWIRDRLEDFHVIDQKSAMFRYPEVVPDGELWIDFHQLKLVMRRMTDAFDQYIQRQGGTP